MMTLKTAGGRPWNRINLSHTQKQSLKLSMEGRIKVRLFNQMCPVRKNLSQEFNNSSKKGAQMKAKNHSLRVKTTGGRPFIRRKIKLKVAWKQSNTLSGLLKFLTIPRMEGKAKVSNALKLLSNQSRVKPTSKVKRKDKRSLGHLMLKITCHGQWPTKTIWKLRRRKNIVMWMRKSRL